VRRFIAARPQAFPALALVEGPVLQAQRAPDDSHMPSTPVSYFLDTAVGLYSPPPPARQFTKVFLSRMIFPRFSRLARPLYSR